MSKMHRVAWIDSQIRGKKFPNSYTIAEQFNISSRQASRDIEYLRDSMCAPIEYCHRRKGYFYAEETFTIPHLLVTEQQKQGLSYLVQQYRRMEGEYATHMANLFSRLLDQTTDDDHAEIALPIFPIDSKELHLFDVLNEAIQSHKKVQLAYLRNEQEMLEVEFSPYKLYTYRNENYVVGYCSQEKLMRFFSLKVVEKVVLSAERYDLTPLLRQVNVVPDLIDEHNTAIIQFSIPEYASLLQLRSTQIAPNILKIEYYEKNKLISSLLESPSDFRIISPCWLKNLVQIKLTKILQHHDHDKLCQTSPSTMKV